MIQDFEYEDENEEKVEGSRSVCLAADAFGWGRDWGRLILMRVTLNTKMKMRKRMRTRMRMIVSLFAQQLMHPPILHQQMTARQTFTTEDCNSDGHESADDHHLFLLIQSWYKTTLLRCSFIFSFYSSFWTDWSNCQFYSLSSFQNEC